jgi:hypothetical protein
MLAHDSESAVRLSLRRANRFGVALPELAC